MYAHVAPVPEMPGNNNDSDEEKGIDKADKSMNNVKKPSRISENVLKRFEALKKRTDYVTKRSTEKRIKHLQKTAIEKVVEEFKRTDELDVLHKYDVKFGPAVSNHGNHSKERTCTSSSVNDQKIQPTEKIISPEVWSGVQQYLNVNDHLLAPAAEHGHHKCGLEKQIDAAIKTGDVAQAEKLSDNLATRDFGTKIAQAIDARDYLKRKKEEEQTAKMKKKKRLAWGFDHKQRWETKSNM